MSILYTILIFGLLIFIHELGHFIVARLCKVKVNEFSLGMGPAIFKIQGKVKVDEFSMNMDSDTLKKQEKGTLYALRLFPIGGYVSMEGEQEDSEDINAFNKKSVPKRIAICIAGATMNLILGFVIILSTYMGVKYHSSTTVAQFKENPTSSQTGLQIGDEIIKMNKTRIYTDRDIVFEALRDTDGIIPMVVKRDGKKVNLDNVKFQLTEENGHKSIYLDFKVEPVKATFLNTVSQAFKNTYTLARNSWVSIGDLFTGKIAFSELSGPVGVGQVVDQAAKIGFMSILSLAAFISISVGMFNLLPFPALDGGRIVFLIIEAIRRKPLNPKYEGYINAAGLVLLLTLMVVVTFKDIWNLF